MKRMTALFLAALILTFCGCSDGMHGAAEEKLIESNKSAVICGDMLYYNKRAASGRGKWSGYLQPISFLYQDLSNIRERGLPVFGDELTDMSENPFRTLDSFNMLIDPTATAENGGEAVIIFEQSCGFVGDDPDHPNRAIELTRLVSYNTRTGRFKIICDGIVGSFISFCLYGETLIYETLDPDLGATFYSVGRQGGKSVSLGTVDSPETLFLSVYGGKIYYAVPESGGVSIYTCDIKSAEHERIDTVPVMFPARFLAFIDGAIYYGAAPSDHDDYGITYDIVKRDVGGANEQTLLRGVESAICCGGEILYVPHGDSVSGDENMTISYYKYDIESGESAMLFTYTLEDAEARIFSVTAFSDKYIFCVERDIVGGSAGRQMCFDRRTGEILYIPTEEI